MCLAVPGKVVEIESDEPLARSGLVSFGGIRRQVNLSAVPAANVGDYVLVHAGFALSTIDADEAAKTIKYLQLMAQPLTERKHDQ